MTVTIDPRGAGPRIRLVPAACAPVRPRPGTSRARRRAQRGRVAPLPAATAAAARASLSGAASSRGARWTGAVVWGLALVAHAVVALAVWRTHAEAPVSRSSTRITVQVHEVPPPLSRPVAATPPAAPARPSAPRVARPEVPQATRPPQPAAAPPAPPVKVVGLSLESTSEAGPGPSFAVGDTLGGSTATTAQHTAPAPTGDPPAGPNRVARGVPRAGSVLTPPRRLQEVKPHYPDARRAAGVEADVLLIVSLDATGRVLSVTVGRSSGEEAFDESALQAARQERFSPALRDGVPVPTTFTFTTHFRLDLP